MYPRLTLAEIQAAMADPTIVDQAVTLTPREEAAVEAAWKTYEYHRRSTSSPKPSMKYAVVAALRSLEQVIEEPPA